MALEMVTESKIKATSSNTHKPCATLLNRKKTYFAEFNKSNRRQLTKCDFYSEIAHFPAMLLRWELKIQSREYSL